jgi:hypothetical protein
MSFSIEKRISVSALSSARIYRSSARIYRSSFGRENDRFQENKPKPLIFNLNRTQKRRSRLILDEIKLGGGFQILGLRRGGAACFHAQ